MEEASSVLFWIGPLAVTSRVTTMWAIILILTVLSIIAEPQNSACRIVELFIVKFYKIVAGGVLLGHFISEFGGSLYKTCLVSGSAHLLVRFFELLGKLLVCSCIFL